jgi:hypothetical protein
MILLAGENRRVVFSRTATADVDWPVHIKLEPAWRGAPVWSGSWHGRVGAGGPTCSCSRKKGEKHKEKRRKEGVVILWRRRRQRIPVRKEHAPLARPLPTRTARTSSTPPAGGTSRGGPPYCGDTILPARRLCCPRKVSAPLGLLPSPPLSIDEHLVSERSRQHYQAAAYGFSARFLASIFLLR